MSTVTMNLPIDQLSTLPLRQRLQIMEVLLESIEGNRAPEPVSDEFADEPHSGCQEHEADPPSSLSWHEVRTEIRTVCTHYHRAA